MPGLPGLPGPALRCAVTHCRSAALPLPLTAFAWPRQARRHWSYTRTEPIKHVSGSLLYSEARGTRPEEIRPAAPSQRTVPHERRNSAISAAPTLLWALLLRLSSLGSCADYFFFLHCSFVLDPGRKYRAAGLLSVAPIRLECMECLLQWIAARCMTRWLGTLDGTKHRVDGRAAMDHGPWVFG